MRADPFQRIAVSDVPFQVTSLDAATRWMTATARDPDRRGIAIRLANAYCVALASKDKRYGRLLASTGVNFPDGAPVVAVMNALQDGATRASRVRGPSFFRRVLEDGVSLGVRHFFLGSTPETLEALKTATQALYPGIRIAGAYSPPFAPVDEAYLSDLVARSASWDADIVWVGMGTPKQDFIAQALADQGGMVAVGVGAGFDFLAGTVSEAPAWVQKRGLEWAYRFAAEPQRLWQRYVFGNSRFLALVVRQLMRDGVLHRRRGRERLAAGEDR